MSYSTTLQRVASLGLSSFLLCCAIGMALADGPIRPPLSSGADLCPASEPAAAPLGPVMEVRGNDYVIPDGSNTTRTADNTDFGFEYVDERSDNHYFFIYNMGDANLVLTGPVYVAIGSGDDSDFEVRIQPSATTLAPGEHTSFAVAFEPNYYGIRRAYVYIYSNDANSPYTFRIEGGDDDDDDYWRVRCGMASADHMSLDLVLAIAVLAGLVVVGHRIKARERA